MSDGKDQKGNVVQPTHSMKRFDALGTWTATATQQGHEWSSIDLTRDPITMVPLKVDIPGPIEWALMKAPAGVTLYAMTTDLRGQTTPARFVVFPKKWWELELMPSVCGLSLNCRDDNNNHVPADVEVVLATKLFNGEFGPGSVVSFATEGKSVHLLAPKDRLFKIRVRTTKNVGALITDIHLAEAKAEPKWAVDEMVTRMNTTVYNANPALYPSFNDRKWQDTQAFVSGLASTAATDEFWEPCAANDPRFSPLNPTDTLPYLNYNLQPYELKATDPEVVNIRKLWSTKAFPNLKVYGVAKLTELKQQIETVLDRYVPNADAKGEPVLNGAADDAKVTVRHILLNVVGKDHAVFIIGGVSPNFRLWVYLHHSVSHMFCWYVRESAICCWAVTPKTLTLHSIFYPESCRNVALNKSIAVRNCARLRNT